MKRSDENVFPRVAREGRKFKVGICAVSQQPKLIDDELLFKRGGDTVASEIILGRAKATDREHDIGTRERKSQCAGETP